MHQITTSRDVKLGTVTVRAGIYKHDNLLYAKLSLTVIKSLLANGIELDEYLTYILTKSTPPSTFIEVVKSGNNLYVAKAKTFKYI